MYAVAEHDIYNGATVISAKCIQDFKCKDGYIVVVGFDEFEGKLKSLNSNGYEVDAGLVDYHYLAHSDTKKLLTENSVRNLFVKHPTFSYQKEFRIAVTKQLYKPGEPPVDSITYHFPHGLSPDKAQMIPVSHLKQEGHDYIIQLSK